MATEVRRSVGNDEWKSSAEPRTICRRDLDVTSACNRISLRRRHHRHLSLQRTLTRRKFDDWVMFWGLKTLPENTMGRVGHGSGHVGSGWVTKFTVLGGWGWVESSIKTSNEFLIIRSCNVAIYCRLPIYSNLVVESNILDENGFCIFTVAEMICFLWNTVITQLRNTTKAKHSTNITVSCSFSINSDTTKYYYSFRQPKVVQKWIRLGQVQSFMLTLGRVGSGWNISRGVLYRPHSIFLASCKPGCKPGRRLAWACRKQVESMSKAGRKPAANLLQTKSMLAAMKKRKHSTWVKQCLGLTCFRHAFDLLATRSCKSATRFAARFAACKNHSIAR